MAKAKTKRKLTVFLDVRIADGLREAAERGDAPSQSQLVERAVGRLLVELRRERIATECRQAAADDQFLSDVESVMRDFGDADAEAAGLARD